MIHGIYLKTRKRGSWRLCSIAQDLETAEVDSKRFLAEVKEQMKPVEEDIQVAIQTFDSSFHIPEYLKEIKTKKLLYN